MASRTSTLTYVLQARVNNLEAGLNRANTKLSGFQRSTSTISSNIAASLAGAFAVGTVVNFGMEIAKLAGEAQGVEAAFARLENSRQVLEDLKKATGGTVSELELMKRTVQASNFGISLKALPKLLEFATLRAQQTGQSVDYLVDSIVTGIGRKSPLILDNLGISAVALKEKLGGVSIAAADVGTVAEAVGAIASEGLENMAGFSENAATKVQQLGASWADFKVILGEAINNSGILNDSLDKLTLTLSQMTEAKKGNISWWKALAGIRSPVVAAVNQMEILAKKTADLSKEQELSAKIAEKAQFIYDTAMMRGIDSMDSFLEVGNRLGDYFSNLPNQYKNAALGQKVLTDVTKLYAKAAEDATKSITNLGKAEAKRNQAEAPSILGKTFDSATLASMVVTPMDLQNKLQESAIKYDPSNDPAAQYLREQADQLNMIVSGTVANMAIGIAEAIGSGNLKGVLQGLLETLAQGIIDMGKMLVQQGIMLKAFATAPPTAKIAIGLAAIAVGSAFKAASARLGASASGGGGGGSSSNNFSSNTLNGQSIQVVGVVKGKDLAFVLDKQSQLNRRSTGG